jgi:hypothetical protein
LTAQKQRRLNAYERAHVEIFTAGTDLDAEADGRTAVGVVWRARDGRLFSELRPVREPDSGPDAVAIVLDGSPAETRFVELRLLDGELYELECSRHAAVLERAEAELAARDAELEQTRREAPKDPLRTTSVWSLPELLDRLDATDGVLALHDDRVVCALPRVGLLGHEAQYATAVEQLRTLLVASRLGTTAVPCDADRCDGDAVRVGVGGAFLCADHA